MTRQELHQLGLALGEPLARQGIDYVLILVDRTTSGVALVSDMGREEQRLLLSSAVRNLEEKRP